MVLGSRYLKRLLLLLMSLLLAFAFSCGQRESYIGKYVIYGEEPSKDSETYIELKEKGMGAWRIGDDEVSFRWDLKDGEIWLKTKTGGIIIAKIKDDTLEITLPGAKMMSFKKTQ
jgi:hypothetical protein